MGCFARNQSSSGPFWGRFGAEAARIGGSIAFPSIPLPSHPNLVWGRSSLAQHLTTLLASSDMQVVLAVLNLLYVFSKRSNYITRLGSDKRSPLLSRLQHLAEVRHPWVGLGGGRVGAGRGGLGRFGGRQEWFGGR